MGKAKGRNRIEKGVKPVSGAPEPAVDSPAVVDDEAATFRNDYTIDLPGGDRVKFRQVLDDRDRLVDFALTHQHQEGTDWFDVARADCAHDEVHLHLWSFTGAEIARRVLADSSDMDDGYDLAEEAVIGAWENNLRRWSHGR